MWTKNTDLNAGITLKFNSFFVLDGSLYGLGQQAGTKTGTIGGKYNTVSNEWETNFDINAGIASRDEWEYTQHFFPIIDFAVYTATSDSLFNRVIILF